MLAKWAANAPLAMASQYIYKLKKYKAIAIDVGDKDGLKSGAMEFSRILSESGIENKFEVYEGDHVNRVAERMQKYVVPFFSQNLTFEQLKQ